jgi:hypothetical protein
MKNSRCPVRPLVTARRPVGANGRTELVRRPESSPKWESWYALRVAYPRPTILGVRVGCVQTRPR